MQVTIARQLGLDPSTVSNFFMNARRRSVDKWKDDKAEAALQLGEYMSEDEDFDHEDHHIEDNSPPMVLHHSSSSTRYTTEGAATTLTPSLKSNTVLVSATPAAVVQHLHHHEAGGMTPTAALDL